MAIFKKNTKTKETQPPQQNMEKLLVFISIVNRGQGSYVLKLMENEGANAQFVQRGEGTAKKEIRDILGIDDNTKEVIFSIISNDKVENAKRELDAFFHVNKKNRGIGFSIPMTSIIGMKVYQFLVASN